jgi:hypothetical protein
MVLDGSGFDRLDTRERYKSGVSMAGCSGATMLAFLELEEGRERWDEDRARSGGVTGVACWRDSDGADCR